MNEQECSLLQQELDECRELLFEVVNQACRMDTGELDSCALSAYADGLRYLCKHGFIVITSEYGRRVIATDKKQKG